MQKAMLSTIAAHRTSAGARSPRRVADMIRMASWRLAHALATSTRILFAALLFCSASAYADAVFNVDSTFDQIDSDVGDGVCRTAAGSCTLRAAVMQANHLTASGLATINVPAGTYPLTLSQGGGGHDETNSELQLTAPLAAGQTIVVRGAGAAQTIIDGNLQFKGFTIGASRDATLTDFSIRNGVGIRGGGIYNAGDLRLLGVVIENGQADQGGGIYNRGTLAMYSSTVRGNRSTVEGGGIIAEGATRIVDSTVSGNSAGTGGGLLNVSSALTIVSSTISGNIALGDGGGIYNAGTTYLYGSSVIDNDADDDHDKLGGIGGGVYSVAGTRFLVVNAIIAGNAFVAYVNPNNCNGNLEVYGWNLFDEVDGCTFTGNGGAAWGPIALTMFGPLQDNGGPTKTHALLPGSRAIDTTDNALGCVDDTGETLATDQRGAPRIAGARCDVGAFEYGSVVPVDDGIFQNGFESGPVL